MIGARTRVLLYCLTLVAGYADAVAFFSLGVFTANMTGNTVLLGGAIVGLFGRRLPGDIGVLLPLLSLAFFVAGSATAAVILRGERGRPPRRTAAVLLAVAVLLGVTAGLQGAYGSRVVAHSVAILSAVMGLQSIVAVRAGVEGVSTTFVTGTLVRSIMNLLGSPIESPVLAAEGRTNAWVWLCYLAGAAGGALALRDLGTQALWIPAVVVALLLAVV
ncbi:MAG TPA: YoaK family protein [Candidatus Tumulicola sp.]|nr:YoaK family protein [Candidatus Tumulicola sp.]